MTEIGRILQLDERYIARNVKLLGDSLALQQDVIDLYDTFNRLTFAHADITREDMRLLQYFPSACRYNLTMGTLALLRGHWHDAIPFTRQSVEYAGFSRLIRANPALASVYTKALGDDEAYKIYRNAFTNSKVFPKTDPLLSRLYGCYDSESKSVHSSVYALASHCKETDDPTLEIYSFYQDNERPQFVVVEYLKMVDTHHGVIQVFERVFDDLLTPYREQWGEQKNAAGARFLEHKTHWTKELGH